MLLITVNILFDAARHCTRFLKSSLDGQLALYSLLICDSGSPEHSSASRQNSIQSLPIMSEQSEASGYSHVECLLTVSRTTSSMSIFSRASEQHSKRFCHCPELFFLSTLSQASFRYSPQSLPSLSATTTSSLSTLPPASLLSSSQSLPLGSLLSVPAAPVVAQACLQTSIIVKSNQPDRSTKRTSSKNNDGMIRTPIATASLLCRLSLFTSRVRGFPMSLGLGLP